jgi:hypothetical protein
MINWPCLHNHHLQISAGAAARSDSSTPSPLESSAPHSGSAALRATLQQTVALVRRTSAGGALLRATVAAHMRERPRKFAITNLYA